MIIIPKFPSKLISKRGRYAMSKYKCFAVLAQEPGYFLTSRELCLQSGISYHSLMRKLPVWVRFKYIKMLHTPKRGCGDRCYKLLAPGYRWLENAKRDLPNAGKFQDDLDRWQSEVMTEDRLKEFRDMDFNSFKWELDSLVTKNRRNIREYYC